MFIVFMAHITLDRPFAINMTGQFDEKHKAISWLKAKRNSITEYYRARNKHFIADDIGEGHILISTPETIWRLMVGGISTDDFPDINNGRPIFFCVGFQYSHKEGSPEPHPEFWARIKRTYLNACGLAAVKAYEAANTTGDRSDILIDTNHDAEALPEWMVRRGNQKVYISVDTFRWNVTMAPDEDEGVVDGADERRDEGPELTAEELEELARVA